MQTWLQPLPALVFSGLAASAAALPSAGDAVPAKPAAPDAATAQETTEDTVIRAFFKDGMRFETGDKSFQFRLGAKIFYDNAFIHDDNDYHDAFDREQDGAKFRLARISGEGALNEKFEFKWQYDFAPSAGNEVKFKDLYIGIRNLCFGNLRVGQFKEPMGLEELTSIGYSTFLERGAPDRLLPARNIGVMAYDYCHQTKRVNWAVGVFRDDTKNDTGANTRDGAWSETARVSGTPLKQDDDHLLHLGASYSHREFRGDDYTVDFRGESALTGQTVATVTFPTDTVQLVGTEAAWQSGPLSVQSEYVMSFVDRDGGTQVDLNGFYIFGSWFLTGEHRPYKSETGTFSRVHVSNPLGGKQGGNGAFEFALRFSHLNLDSEATPAGGGNVDSVTAGVNWYWNDYLRLMVDVTREEAGGDIVAQGSPSANILGIRLALDI